MSVVATALLYAVPYGRTVGYPLVLVSTLAHELGHGIAALLIGGDFESLRLSSDGSGTALWSGQAGRLGRAFVAAGGLVGPASAALLFLLLGRRPGRARGALAAIGLGLLVADVALVRNLFGFAFVALLGAALLAVAVRGRGSIPQATLVFLAVQLALSVFSRGDYLFTRSARTAGGLMPSDVAVMAEALWLPYWMWGAACGAISVALLLLGMGYFLRGRG